MSFNDRSYKVDAELSPEGWEYAEKLKRFIIDYRSHKESPESKSADEERSLSVSNQSRSWHCLCGKTKTLSVTNTCSRPGLDKYTKEKQANSKCIHRGKCRRASILHAQST